MRYLIYSINAKNRLADKAYAINEILEYAIMNSNNQRYFVKFFINQLNQASSVVFLGGDEYILFGFFIKDSLFEAMKIPYMRFFLSTAINFHNIVSKNILYETYIFNC